MPEPQLNNSLGKAAIETLESRGELRAYPAAELFEQQMREHLQNKVTDYARLALLQQRKNP